MKVGDRSTVEHRRLQEDARRQFNWKRWGPYLSERQWATVREDYSADGNLWNYLTHDMARSTAYRWGEDGLLGICDRECRLCFALALWNEKDPILKERLFGLTNPEGNHSEDVKECYFYLESTPTHSYLKALYKYPQAAFPYRDLVEENRRRGRSMPEYELIDTGVFDESRYFDVFAEYAKASPDDVLIRITVANRGSESARLHLLPTLWFRNTWSWNSAYEEGEWAKPVLERTGPDTIDATHDTLGHFRLAIDSDANGRLPELLFTENESGGGKDAFHRYVVAGDPAALSAGATRGTKAAAHYVLELPPHGEATIRLRLFAGDNAAPFANDFDRVFAERIAETDEFYAATIPQELNEDERRVARQAYAGLLWSKQFYHYVVAEWLEGDRGHPSPSANRRQGHNADWMHLHCRDVLSVPDKWEYPAFFAWDLACHTFVLARVDPEFAKQQLLLLMREWYMHPNGQLPAFEYDLSNVNPPVHAYACWRVYKISAERGKRDVDFLKRAFQKLLLNFTWWVNRQDQSGRNVFSGGFLGLDNIGVFDRSLPLPDGGTLEQADGTAWMGLYCTTMLAISIELARHDHTYEDIASKFFEHFIQIADALNRLGGTGLWDEEDGFYYDRLNGGGRSVPLKVRSLVGLIPLLAVEVLEEDVARRLPAFEHRGRWFLTYGKNVIKQITCLDSSGNAPHRKMLLALASRDRLRRALHYLLDEHEFLSPHGIRSLSKYHLRNPYVIRAEDREYRVGYVPGDADTEQFGGNSNWRGPVWFPINGLLVEALERYHHFYGDDFRIECPAGSGRLINLKELADEISDRLRCLFRAGENGERPGQGAERKFAGDPHWKNLILFYEYFDGDTGAGLGASHQTGWTSLVVRLLEDAVAARRAVTSDER